MAPPAGSALGKHLSLTAPARQVVVQAAVPRGGVQRARGSSGQEVKCGRAFFVPLMEICQTDVPMLKRVPGSLKSSFATAWGRLLQDAVDSRQEAAWSEFFVFPKVILWTPRRGGKRLSKKATVVELVQDGAVVVR